MARNHIPTAAYHNFDDSGMSKRCLETIRGPVEINASGLAAGKGVLIPATLEESIENLETLMVDRAFAKLNLRWS